MTRTYHDKVTDQPDNNQSRNIQSRNIQSRNIQSRNKEIVGRYWEALYSHDWELIGSFFSATSNYVDVGTGETLGGAHGADEIVARLRLGLEPVEAHNHVLGRVIAEDNVVVTEHAEEWVFHTGERVMHPFTSVMELDDDGIIQRWWDYSNLSNLLDNAPAWWLEHIAAGFRDQPAE